MNSFKTSSTDVAYINWHPHQTAGISKRALVFVRDVKIVCHRRTFWHKVHFFFTATPVEKWFSPRIFAPYILKNLILAIWDTEHGGGSVPTAVFVSVSDGQNANP